MIVWRKWPCVCVCVCLCGAGRKVLRAKRRETRMNESFLLLGFDSFDSICFYLIFLHETKFSKEKKRFSPWLGPLLHPPLLLSHSKEKMANEKALDWFVNSAGLMTPVWWRRKRRIRHAKLMIIQWQISQSCTRPPAWNWNGNRYQLKEASWVASDSKVGWWMTISSSD